MMASVKQKDTKPEMNVRSFLHKHGLRYRLHDNNLLGKPDCTEICMDRAEVTSIFCGHRHSSNMKWFQVCSEYALRGRKSDAGNAPDQQQP